MKPPCRDELLSSFPEAESRNGIVYVERSTRGNWEDKQRSRSTPHSLKLFCGALSTIVLWFSLPAVVGCLAMKLLGYSGRWGEASVVSLVVLVVSLITSLGLSLTTRCPLCHGTPLHSRRCPKHRLATRWPLFTFRAATAIRIVCTLSFRCMYCGTPFRLFKKSSRQR